jgi:hypothetical protein
MGKWKVLAAAAAVATLTGCGPCGKKPAPPLTPAEEVLTEAMASWEVGQWCTYRLTGPTGKKSEVNVSLVGKENAPGGDYFWFEVAVERDGVKVISKALVKQLERVSFLTGPKDLTKGSRRLIVKVGAERAVELPLQELKLMEKANELTGRGPDLDEVFGGGEGVSSRDVGPVAYDALGGERLDCRKLVLTKDGADAGTVYASDEVPILGVAYSEHRRGKLELLDCGTSGATTAITEEPLRFDVTGLVTGLAEGKFK